MPLACFSATKPIPAFSGTDLMKTLLTTSFILLLTACAGSATKSYSLPEGLSGVSAVNSLACRYEKTAGDKNRQPTNWYFWRQTQRTETRDELSNQGEIWERNGAGQLFYTRVFYNEKVALEFVPGDLAATGAEPSWQQLTSLVNPEKLGKELALQGKADKNGMPVEYYKGAVNNIMTEVDWLPDLQLPARILKMLPDGRLSLMLAECGNDSKFKVKPIMKSEFDSLRRIDFTDLGDMEDDPMVRHIERLMGGHHHGQ